MTEPTAAAAQRAAVRELSVVAGITTIGAVIISRVGATPPLDQYVHVAVATLFLWTALHVAQRDPRGVEWFGLSLGGFFGDPSAPHERGLLQDLRAAFPSLLRELGVAVALAAIVFPPFALAFRYWHQPEHALTLAWPDDVLSYVLAQVLVVGLPEEALFRGYMQSRLTDVLPTEWRWNGVVIPWLAIVVQAALFGLVHFAVDLNVARLSVFFPGLLFGVIRAWRGGVGAAVFFHALCNLYSDVLVRGWL